MGVGRTHYHMNNGNELLNELRNGVYAQPNDWDGRRCSGGAGVGVRKDAQANVWYARAGEVEERTMRNILTN